MRPYKLLPYELQKLQFAAPYLSAMDCVLNENDKAIYCSSELTSGYRLYQRLEDRNLKSRDDLQKHFPDDWKNILKTNEDAANIFANSIRHENKGAIVITPAPLKIRDWDQPDYTAFWDELIRTRVKEVHFNEHWEYSNGCTAEMVGALDAKIPAFDAKENPIDLETAVSLVRHALEELQKKELDTKKVEILEINFHLLDSLRSESFTLSTTKLSAV